MKRLQTDIWTPQPSQEDEIWATSTDCGNLMNNSNRENYMANIEVIDPSMEHKPMTNGETVLVNGDNDEGSCCSEEQATANGIDVNVVTTNVAVKKSAISATTR